MVTCVNGSALSCSGLSRQHATTALSVSTQWSALPAARTHRYNWLCTIVSGRRTLGPHPLSVWSTLLHANSSKALQQQRGKPSVLKMSATFAAHWTPQQVCVMRLCLLFSVRLAERSRRANIFVRLSSRSSNRSFLVFLLQV